ncbi:MAG: hypothetical protein D4R48_03170 [Nitrosomonadales bacterium]|nr:MAG: hypothetical protein D4R48_03170 [Nitrosomonadales bacterium]
MSLSRRDIEGIALRLLFWLPVLFMLGWLYGRQYANIWLPVYRGMLDWALSDFRVLTLDIGFMHELVFKTQVIAERIMVVEGQVLPSGFTVNASTPMYIAVVHPIILAVVALIWPGLNWSGRIVRLLVSLPCLLLLELLDVPLVLASSINDLLSYSINPTEDQASLLVDWVHVMDGGGRFALSFAAAIMAAVIHQRLTKWGAPPESLSFSGNKTDVR